MVSTARFTPLNGHRTLEEQTYQRLREAITRGALAPGTKLVGSQLSVELDVSRITVANALKRLASEGFVVVTPHKEAMVAALDPESLSEVFAIRYALEGLVLRAAAERITEPQIALLRERDAELRAYSISGDLTGYRRAERAFHIGIYEAAHLSLTAAILTDLWDRLEPYRGRRYVSTGLLNANHDEHATIIDALANHDGVRAAEAMRRHVASGYERFLDALQRSLA
ncbi:MAG: GntR family transcriptional regulator [Chloroflexota bacterium]|nr:GntR family transcriptional regulator [Chloroflexota bacterium]